MKYYMHFLLSNYSQSLLNCYNDNLLTKDEIIEEAQNDLFNFYISELEYNIILNHINF